MKKKINIMLKGVESKEATCNDEIMLESTLGLTLLKYAILLLVEKSCASAGI